MYGVQCTKCFPSVKCFWQTLCVYMIDFAGKKRKKSKLITNANTVGLRYIEY